MKKQWDNPPTMQIDTDKTFQATMNTSKGSIELTLYPAYAPQTVNNFIFLAREGFYDNITFHRVIADFMVQ
ncbi:MAG: peptidylprolyl isomerase, partial [Deltaproteobacteria bacterium]|nr:peptidylprolyl isomerase [Candidatus Tharpella aukensis]